MVKEGQSTPAETALAVDGQNIYYYFDGKKKSSVLDGLNISVPQGVIYSLLGPSGCGKTTLLKCMVGQRKLQEGSLKIYGRTPGSKGFFIPGRGVGYMPQELALYLEMTTEETLRYFGSLYLMNKQEINKRISFLVQLLSLPDKDKQIKYLSGGEQRRVSFAAALVHRPPLLILDEPTVGVDPLLRQAIWDHLVALAKNERLTIIITTHYTEEARQAHIVGLMRNGQLLAERNPEDLIKQYRVVTLEDVFLKLCQNNCTEDEDLETSSGALNSVETLSPDCSAKPYTVCVLKEAPEICANKNLFGKNEQVFELNTMKEKHPVEVDGNKKGNETFQEMTDGHDNRTTLLTSPSFPNDNVNVSRKFTESWTRFSGLTKNNFLRLRRNIFFLLFQLFLPCTETVFFCLCIGDDPFDLPVAIANMDEDTSGLSNTLLHTMSNHTFRQKAFGNFSLAFESVKNGQSWAAIHMGQEFSACLVDRYLEGADVNNVTVECSNINLYMDMTNQQIYSTIYSSLLRSFQTFASALLEQNGKNALIAELPLKVEDTIYGSLTPSYLEFIAPAMILSITYIMSLGLTQISVIAEKKQGLLDRTFVAGATASEIVLSLFMPLLMTMLVQVILTLACAFLIFHIPCNGLFVWVVITVWLTGFGGMAYGLLISAFCEDPNIAIMIATGTSFSNLILSGLIWPVESMPYYIRYFSYCLPLTLITQTFRNILSRGWSITDHHIWDGYLISIAWIITFMILATILFKIKK